MRRKLFLIITFVICCFSLNVFASTNYQVRTEDNLGVPDYIEVTEERKSHILSTPLVDSSEKIYDFGELFSADEEKELYDKVAKYIEEKTNSRKHYIILFSAIRIIIYISFIAL